MTEPLRLRPTRLCAALLLMVLALIAPTQARAWGDEGHEIVGEIATHFLQPAVKARVFAMLVVDPDPLTSPDFVSRTTWADRFREASAANKAATANWHFTDIEVGAPDLTSACFGMPAIPAGTPASAGPASDCAVDKIDEFAAELASPTTSPPERLLALKFPLHIVGDLHQPLHSSDEHDGGGNGKFVSTTRLGSGRLHAFWDTQFVEQLGTDPIAVGDALAAKIKAADVATWSQGAPTDWANESFVVARDKVYGTLPKPKAGGTYALPQGYVKASKAIVTLQLQRAGVRLAKELNTAIVVD